VLFKLTPISLIIFIAAFVNLFVAYSSWQRRKSKGGVYFACAMLAITCWTLCAGLDYAAVPVSLKVFFAKLEYLWYMSAVALFAAFALSYAGYEDWLKKTWVKILLIGIPISNILLAWTNELHGWVWADFRVNETVDNVVIFEHGPAFTWVVLSGYVLLLIIFVSLLTATRKGPELARKQARLLLWALLALVASNLLYLFDFFNIPGVDWSSVMFSITGLLFLFALYGSRFMDIVPVARNTMIERMADGVVVLDVRGNLVDFNPAAQAIFGIRQDDLWTSLQAALARWPEIIALLENPARPQATEITIGAPARIFDLRLTPLEDNRNVVYGLLVVMRDISARKQAEVQKEATREALAQRTAELGERVKELNCLYGLSALIEASGESIESLLQSAAELLPPAWQYPPSACARITLDGQSFSTSNFQQTPWMQQRPILVEGVPAGSVMVGYLEAQSNGDEEPFLPQEELLLEAIAERLGKTVERIRARRALRASDERYQHFIAHSFEAISRTEFDAPIDITLPVETQIDLIYENAYLAECNQAMADMYHVPSPQAFVGVRLLDAHGGTDNPVNRATFRKFIENGYKSINDETIEYTADGKPVWFLSNTIGTVENGRLVRLWGTALDITARKQAENIVQTRLRITEFAAGHALDKLLQNELDELCAFSASPIGFFHFVEPDQRTLALQAWSTRTLEEMCTAEGKGHAYDIDQAGVWVDCIREGQPVIHNDYASLPAARRKGLPEGHAPVVREMVIPIMREQRIVAIIGVGNKAQDYTEEDVAQASRLADLIWDITERKRAESQREAALEALRALNATLEQHVAERTRELAEANLRLAELSHLKDEFITRISHELHTPLANVKLYLRLLEQGQPEKRAAYLHTLYQQTDRLQHLIEDLLDVSHLTLDTIAVRAAPLDVTALLRDLLTDQAARALERGLTLTVLPTPDRPTLTTDRNLLRQALSNVLTNALSYTPRGGAITLQTDRTTTPEGEWVTIEVRDTGLGISAQDLPRIFEPFYRGAAAADYKTPGTGVGLAITQRLIERLGGRITMESNVGQGTVFTFWLRA
jgi:signal transduction histidine kinase